jgi:hypothetical protein
VCSVYKPYHSNLQQWACGKKLGNGGDRRTRSFMRVESPDLVKK